ncbi:18066_t:CDS:2, partial [Dentiscutata erythropus]
MPARLHYVGTSGQVASRDSNIFIWDTRIVGMQTPEGETLYKPVNSIRSPIQSPIHLIIQKKKDEEDLFHIG